VFTELMPLLKQRVVMITISDVGEGLLRVNVIPRKLDGSADENGALTVPLSITGSRAARAKIHEAVTNPYCGIGYWLDVGNNADTGQFVLGQPLNRANKHKTVRLRAVSELFPEIIDPALDDDQQPSCSAAEALERQHPFINQTLANHALALLSRLFRCEQMAYHGGFLNLASGALVALRAEPEVWRRMRRLRRAA